MLKPIFTLDYEIHGNGDGCPYALMVEPTDRLLRLFEGFGAKLTIMADVAEILASLGVKATTPMIEVWNKLDLVDPSLQAALVAQADGISGVYAISAITGEGLDGLLVAVSQHLDDEKTDVVLTIGFAEGRKYAWLHAEGVVQAEDQGERGHRVEVRWTARQAARYAAL